MFDASSFTTGLPPERLVLHRHGFLGVAWNVWDGVLIQNVFMHVIALNTIFMGGGCALTHGSTSVHLYGTNPLPRSYFPSPLYRSVPQQGPVGRSWHSLTPVSPDHIFLFGGFTTYRETLSEWRILPCPFSLSPWHDQMFLFLHPFVIYTGDAWLYCVSKNEWQQYKHNHTQSPR